MKKCRVKVDAVTLVAAKDSVVIVSDKQFDLISHMVEEIGPKKVKKDESTDLQNDPVDSKDVSTDQPILDESSKVDVTGEPIAKPEETKE